MLRVRTRNDLADKRATDKWTRAESLVVLGVISAPLTGVASFEIQSGVFSPKVLYKDRRLLIPLDEAEGTRGKYALMVTPTRASPSQPTSASVAVRRGFTSFP